MPPDWLAVGLPRTSSPFGTATALPGAGTRRRPLPLSSAVMPPVVVVRAGRRAGLLRAVVTASSAISALERVERNSASPSCAPTSLKPWIAASNRSWAGRPRRLPWSDRDRSFSKHSCCRWPSPPRASCCRLHCGWSGLPRSSPRYPDRSCHQGRRRPWVPASVLACLAPWFFLRFSIALLSWASAARLSRERRPVS